MTDQDDLDGPVARHLARTLREVAATTPVSDRRDAIESLLPPSGAGSIAAVAPSDGSEHRPGHRRTVTALAVAAVVLVVVALAAVAIRRGDDGAVDLRPVDDPGAGTGWYLPGDGWTVTAVTAERRDEASGVCPCTTLDASEIGDDPAALVVWETVADRFVDELGDLDDIDAEAIEVGGRPGFVERPAAPDLEIPGIEPDDTVTHVVYAGTRRLIASSSSDLDEAVVLDVLDAWADRIDAGEPVRREDLPLPEGMAASRPQRKSWTFDTVVLVAATNDATGDVVYYQLAPTGRHATLETVLDSDRTTFDGETLTVMTRVGPEDLLAVTRAGGPVDVTTGALLLGGPETDDDVVTALAGSLHEVDTAAWRAALEQLPPDVEVDAALLTAPTLLAPPLTG